MTKQIKNSITLVEYINVLKKEFKRGGKKTMIAFIFMQFVRICMFMILFSWIQGESYTDVLDNAIVTTIVIYPIEVLFCWKLSNRIRIFCGQLTGRF